MKYQFDYVMKALDLWQLSMYGIYRSMVGLINVIFTAAMVGLTIRFWSEASIWIRILLILGMSLFTVIQPLLIYRRAKKQLSTISKEISIRFDDYGVHVETGGKTKNLKWKTIKGITKNPTLMVVYTTATHGFILTNKVLGEKREEFYRDVAKKIKR